MIMNHEDAQAVQSIVGFGKHPPRPPTGPISIEDMSAFFQPTPKSSAQLVTETSSPWAPKETVPSSGQYSTLAAPPHMGGHHGGFRHHGLRRHHFRGRSFVDWPWWWGPEVTVEPASCAWMPSESSTAKVRATLSTLPWQVGGWRAAFVDGGWWGETNSPHAYYVCVVSTGFHGLGMEYTEHPKPGDYHVNGNGVVLRATPNYTAKAIATLQNGENVYVFGDVETDPEYMVLKDNTVVKNNGSVVGIDYMRVGTQTHGAGWVGMLYIDPGAGTKFGAPTPAPVTKSEGMGLVSKILLGGAIVATVAGGAFLIGKAVSVSRPRQLAHA
jgi:hypothetical protein